MTKNIPFVANSKKYFTFSLIVIALILAGSLILGVELDIQFKGGAIINYSYEGQLNRDDFTRAAQEHLAAGTAISVQQVTDLATGRETMVLSLPAAVSLTSEQMLAVTEGIQAAFPANNVQEEAITNVSATMGGEFLAKCLTAVAFACVLMMIYIAFRFRRIGGLTAGMTGVIALIHDVVIIFGVHVFFRIPISGNFIAVVLTILGYSLNDTIVVYDRIRENKRLYGSKLSLAELTNRSINQSVRRTLVTTVSTTGAMVVVAVIALLYNVETILTFAFPMIFGLLWSIYTTLCIAGPLWVRVETRK